MAQKTILLAIIATEEETDALRACLVRLERSLVQAGWPEAWRSAPWRCLAVYQTRGGQAPELPSGVSCLPSTVFSASNARNLALDWAEMERASHLVFLDLRVYAAPAFFSAAAQALHLAAPLVRCGRLAWEPVESLEATAAARRAQAAVAFEEAHYDPIRASYVGQFLLERDAVKDLRFDETRGPGRETRLKSGEDVLFLFALLQRLGGQARVATARGAPSLFRERRPADMSKQLLYAEGQGALYRLLLRGWRDWSPRLRRMIVVNFVLFIANAGLRVLLLRPHAWDIARLRLKGFREG